MLDDVVVNCVFDRLKPINIIAQRIFHQLNFRIGQWPLKNFVRDLLKIRNANFINGSFAVS
jgi:hypothetical protein